MATDVATVRAKFNGGEFLLSGRSSELKEPPADWSLLPYLWFLSQTGWQAVRGRFEGWEIIAGPKHLSSLKGVSIVSIWAKHLRGK